MYYEKKNVWYSWVNKIPDEKYVIIIIIVQFTLSG